MVAIPLFHRHGHETKLPFYLLWPSFAATVFRRIGKEPIASLLQLWVLRKVGNGTHEVAYKEHEHKAAQKQHHCAKKAGDRDPAFNMGSAKNVQT